MSSSDRRKGNVMRHGLVMSFKIYIGSVCPVEITAEVKEAGYFTLMKQKISANTNNFPYYAYAMFMTAIFMSTFWIYTRHLLSKCLVSFSDYQSVL